MTKKWIEENWRDCVRANGGIGMPPRLARGHPGLDPSANPKYARIFQLLRLIGRPFKGPHLNGILSVLVSSSLFSSF